MHALGQSIAAGPAVARRASLASSSRSAALPRGAPAAGPRRGSQRMTVTAEASRKGDKEVSVVFEPMKEVSGTLEFVADARADQSLARQSFDKSLEDAINDQINIEYNISYVYHAMSSYFNRDNVALPGLSKYFDEASKEERDHAQDLMSLQATRGGRVKMQALLAPQMEYDHSEKGEALHAMELSLALEKLNLTKLSALHKVADESSDFQVADYVERMLQEQADDIKKTAEYVSQLRRVGKGHGTWDWDRNLA